MREIEISKGVVWDFFNGARQWKSYGARVVLFLSKNLMIKCKLGIGQGTNFVVKLKEMWILI